jgi:Flp pilus assembly protein TadG
MVTAETAVALPVLLLVLASAVAALMVVGAELRCVDAAGEGVRAAARGEPAGAVRSLVTRAAPAGAHTTVVSRDGTVTVTVRAAVRPLGSLPFRFTVTASATGELEPGAPAADP